MATPNPELHLVLCIDKTAHVVEHTTRQRAPVRQQLHDLRIPGTRGKRQRGIPSLQPRRLWSVSGKGVCGEGQAVRALFRAAASAPLLSSRPTTRTLCMWLA